MDGAPTVDSAKTNDRLELKISIVFRSLQAFRLDNYQLTPHTSSFSASSHVKWFHIHIRIRLQQEIDKTDHAIKLLDLVDRQLELCYSI